MFYFYIIFLIFAALFIIAIHMEAVALLYYLVGIVVSIVTTLLGVWKIVNSAFRKRDEEIRQLLISEQEFKSHKEHTDKAFLSYSKRFDKTEEEIKEKYTELNGKLDKVINDLSRHGETLAKLDERTRK